MLDMMVVKNNMNNTRKYRVSFYKRYNTVEFESVYIVAKNKDEAIYEGSRKTRLNILASITVCEAR